MRIDPITGRAILTLPLLTHIMTLLVLCGKLMKLFSSSRQSANLNFSSFFEFLHNSNFLEFILKFVLIFSIFAERKYSASKVFVFATQIFVPSIIKFRC